MSPCKNCEVIKAWSDGAEARNHRRTLTTDGKELYSYEVQIGDTTQSGMKVLKVYQAHGRFGFRSQTTSCHVGIALRTEGVVTV
jgi:hypothetical protein